MVRFILVSCIASVLGCSTVSYRPIIRNKPAGDLSHLELMKTPEDFKSRVAMDLRVNLQAVEVKLVDIPQDSGVIGMACRVDLILISSNRWVKLTPIKKYALVAHEIGHIFGVPHSMEEVTTEKRGLKIQLFKSLMVGSINYLSDYTLVSFFDFYIEQMRQDINNATIESFMDVMGHTIGKRPTVQDCLKLLKR